MFRLKFRGSLVIPYPGGDARGGGGAGAMCSFILSAALALLPGSWQRREVVKTASASVAVSLFSPSVPVSALEPLDNMLPRGEPLDNMLPRGEPLDNMLPRGAIEQLEAGRVVEVRNFLPAGEVSALRRDAQACFEAGIFNADALATYAQKKSRGGAADPANDRKTMPSFYASKGIDGPWVDPALGDAVARARFKSRMTDLRSQLSTRCIGRPTLATDTTHTHEVSYSRYGPGAFLPRHTDEHHGTLKNAHPVASGDENLKRLQRSLSPVGAASASADAPAGTAAAPAPPRAATRRSVTWLVYLNDDWHAATDGGQLRVHERAEPAVSHVGARGRDLQVGWLRATSAQGEQPVFLDAHRRRGGEAVGGAEARAACMLYVCAADGSKRDLSAKPFAASPTLYLAGGDFFARRLLIDEPRDASRFHLVDAPKSSAAAALLPKVGEDGEDGGERVRDISPQGGTLVLFDSVAVPHEVLAPVGRERFACTGWFHEEAFA